MGLAAKLPCANCGSQCRLVAALVALAAWWLVVGAAPVPPLSTEQPTDFGPEDALLYLHRYGYLNISDFNVSYAHEESFKDALTLYQEFSSLPITGELDAATIQKMLAPRCGVEDINPQGHRRRRQTRYAHIGTRFLKHNLTYSLSNAPPHGSQLSMSEALDALERATAMWSAVAPINISRAPRGTIVNIDLSFRRRDHGLFCSTFDGPDQTLAHASTPLFDKAFVHFDADEDWTLDKFRGIDFFQVAVHELGHALGLDHTFSFNAVMVPWYTYEPSLQLQSDDINGIQALYGTRDEPQSFLRWLKNVVPNVETSLMWQPSLTQGWRLLLTGLEAQSSNGGEESESAREAETWWHAPFMSWPEAWRGDGAFSARAAGSVLGAKKSP